MALQTSMVFSLLLLVSITTAFVVLSWGHLSENIRWAPYSIENRHSEDGHSEFWDKKENSTTDSTNADRRLNASRAAVAETPMPLLFKKNFTKVPRWDFEDVYNVDTPPRNATCAQSLRHSQDESFKESFIPNIRLFMHQDSINMSEWNRLSHFNNPFGFMEYKYDDVMAAVKLIPRPKEPMLPLKPGSDGCVRCAVVGTAGILNGSKMGREIDAHDYIFRMNGAIINGFEEDVGNRTSVYVHTAFSITSSLRAFKKYGYKSVPTDEGIKYVLIPEGMRDFNWLGGLLKGEKVLSGSYRNTSPRTYYGGQYNESRFYVLHPDFLRYVRNRFLNSAHLNSSHWAIVRPTNGAFTLFLALHTCDIVNAYGFMTEDFKKYSNYYFQKTKVKAILYVNHDYMLEKNTWAKLHNSKIMRLYQTT